MFGISFSELLLVGLVALLVLGPERLPGAARTAGLWIGRLKRSFNSIKTEIERELGADEIRRQLHNEHIQSLEQEARKLVDPHGHHAPPPSIHTPAPPGPAQPPVDTPVASVHGTNQAPEASPAHTAPGSPLTTPAPEADTVARGPRPHQESTPAP
jgi:sec-independent protein translocase protein TatB